LATEDSGCTKILALAAEQVELDLFKIKLANNGRYRIIHSERFQKSAKHQALAPKNQVEQS
jgi:hypothetical protein